MSGTDKRTEEQSAFQAQLLENVYEAIVAADENYSITYWNKATEKLFGWKAKEVIGKSLKDVFQTEALESSKEKEIEKMSNQESYEGEVYYKNKNGAYILTFVRSNALRGSKGEFKGKITSFTDITERKKTEQEFIATKNKLAKELDDSKLLLELSKRFVSQNNTQELLEQIVNTAVVITHADMGNMQLVEKDNRLKIVAHKGFDPSFVDSFNAVSSESHASFGGAMGSREHEIVNDIAVNPIFINSQAKQAILGAGVRAYQSTPIFSRLGNLLGVIATYRKTTSQPDDSDLQLLDILACQTADLIERMKFEQELKEHSKNLEQIVEERTKQMKDSERLVAIGQTAGMVGHDIRNPLQAITGDLYLLKNYLTLMPENITKREVAESLDSIEQNVAYINKIVADLQDYARPINPEYVEVELSKVLARVFETITFPDNIKLSKKIKDTEKFSTDPTLLRRALSNLINNAIQAMPEGGALEITSYLQGDKSIVMITDTGVGIPDEVKPKLFTPMMTTKSKGQGFGLAVSKRLIEAMKGTISFESEKGKGTTFTIQLPSN